MDMSIKTDRLMEGVGGLSVGPPPINNACLPTIYDKLDADARSRVRVLNGFLDYRYKVQKRIIEKHRRDANKIHQIEKQKIQKELERVSRKLPYMADLPYLDSKFQFRRTRMNNITGYSTEVKPMKGIVTEKDSKPFCDRYFSHHIPAKSSEMKKLSSSLRSLDIGEDRHPLSRSQKLLLTKRMSVSDNCISTYDYLQRKMLINKAPVLLEDDAITI